MKNASITILSLVTLAGLSACEETICTDDLKTSVLLSLESDQGGAIEGAAISVTDGAITEDCPALEAGLYGCGQELAGELTISMAAYGFEPEELDVSVEEDECHVISQEIAHALMAVDCTAEVVPAVIVSVLDDDGAVIEGAEVSHAPLSEEIGAESIDCTPGDAAFYCGDDVPGDFEIMAQAEGFQIGSAAVSVEMDEVGCHVVTQSVDITLAAE